MSAAQPTDHARQHGNFGLDESVMAVRAGHGLLTGLLRCGRCGRKLHIRYWGKRGTAARYLCEGDFPTGGHYCLGFGGSTIDKRVSGEILNALSPLGVEASLVAIEQRNAKGSDRREALTRQLQQLDYEAHRAFDQYNQVDPTNRLVAEVLEQRWNEKLEALTKLKTELDSEELAPQPLSHAEQEAMVALGENFASVWNDPACPMVLKKQIARTLINEIMATWTMTRNSFTLSFIGTAAVTRALKCESHSPAPSCTRPHWKMLS